MPADLDNLAAKVCALSLPDKLRLAAECFEVGHVKLACSILQRALLDATVADIADRRGNRKGQADGE